MAVELKRLTREGYLYQLSVKEAQAANRDPLIPPTPLHGNIRGALGIFTSYTCDRRVLRLRTSERPADGVRCGSARRCPQHGRQLRNRRSSPGPAAPLSGSADGSQPAQSAAAPHTPDAAG